MGQAAVYSYDSRCSRGITTCPLEQARETFSNGSFLRLFVCAKRRVLGGDGLDRIEALLAGAQFGQHPLSVRELMQHGLAFPVCQDALAHEGDDDFVQNVRRFVAGDFRGGS